MDQTQSLIDNRQFSFAGVSFDIQITNIYQDIDNPRRYYVCWQVVCEGETSPQKDVHLSFNDKLELPEINNETKLMRAKAFLREFAMWNDGDVVTISYSDGSPNHVCYTIEWHKQLKTFNQMAWA